MKLATSVKQLKKEVFLSKIYLNLNFHLSISSHNPSLRIEYWILITVSGKQLKREKQPEKKLHFWLTFLTTLMLQFADGQGQCCSFSWKFPVPVKHFWSISCWNLQMDRVDKLVASLARRVDNRRQTSATSGSNRWEKGKKEKGWKLPSTHSWIIEFCCSS